jgi:hypothetical protein
MAGQVGFVQAEKQVPRPPVEPQSIRQILCRQALQAEVLKMLMKSSCLIQSPLPYTIRSEPSWEQETLQAQNSVQWEGRLCLDSPEGLSALVYLKDASSWYRGGADTRFSYHVRAIHEHREREIYLPARGSAVTLKVE